MFGSLFLAEIDWIRDAPVLGLSAFVLLFVIAFVVAYRDDRINQSTLQFALAQILFVPLLIWGTFWCYQHPERLADTPDAWQYDMRVLWPFMALFDVALLAWFFHVRQASHWKKKGFQLLADAERLRAEGKIEEGNAASAKGLWILTHKYK